MKNVWNSFEKPIMILAPMEDVTDTVFRQIIIKCGRPDLFFTEFTNVEGLCSKGFERVAKRLIYNKIEKPIIAQVWGQSPEKFFEAAKIIKKMGFDGIDINMGCPEKKVVKRCSGAGLIGSPSLAKEIIESVKKGAGGLPISVKTRIGIKKIETKEWISFLLKQNLDAITVHGRTVAEQSDVPCHWDEIGLAVELRNKLKSNTLIIGNGDVKNYEDAMEKYKKYGVDGIMIGRGIFSNLWIFNCDRTLSNISSEEKLKLLKEHIELFDKSWKKTKNFSLMKKFYKVYISGHPDAKSMRAKLMEFKTAKETMEFLNSLVS